MEFILTEPDFEEIVPIISVIAVPVVSVVVIGQGASAGDIIIERSVYSVEDIWEDWVTVAAGASSTQTDVNFSTYPRIRVRTSNDFAGTALIVLEVRKGFTT